MDFPDRGPGAFRRYLFLGKLSRVGKAGEYVLARDVRVGVQEIFDRIPICQHLHDEVYRNSLSLDARLTITNVGVYRDSLMHGHLPLYEYYSKCVACDSFNLGVRIELGGFHQRGFVVAVPSIHKTSRVVALGSIRAGSAAYFHLGKRRAQRRV